jgi:hypothetical protein
MVRLFAPRWTGFDAGLRESLEKFLPSPPNVVEVRQHSWLVVVQRKISGSYVYQNVDSTAENHALASVATRRMRFDKASVVVGLSRCWA